MELRPLGEIMEALENIGFNVSYAYDDLIFIEHTPFLLRFDEDDPRKLYFYGNILLEEMKQEELYGGIRSELGKLPIIVVDHGTFELKQKENEEEQIDVIFYEKKSPQ